MEKEDVIKARNWLRSMTRKIPVYSKELENQEELGEATVTYNIGIEFDNSLGVNEKIDHILWNDTDGFCVVVTTGKNQIVNEPYMVGRKGKIVNPYHCYVIDYTEIQQFRIMLDDNGFDQFMQTIKETGKFVGCFADSETRVSSEQPLNDKMIASIKKDIRYRVDPEDIKATNYQK